MTTLELILNLPDELAREAREAGLLTPEAIESMLRDRLRAQAGGELRSLWTRLPAEEISEGQLREIVEEVKTIRAERRKALCYTSDALTLELARVLQYSRLARRIAQLGFSKEALAERYAQLVEIVPAPSIVGAVPTDPDDDAVIACAVAAKATHIVSGDKDLLILGSFRDINILSPADAMQVIESPRAPRRADR